MNAANRLGTGETAAQAPDEHGRSACQPRRVIADSPEHLAANEQDSAFEQLADATDRMRARAALPRTIYVKVSTPLLGELSEWSEPVRVKVERDWNDDTFEMIFRREEAS